MDWDMDPFVVIAFGRKVFRTRVIRHSCDPVWDEKLLFHVRRCETSFKVQLSVLDWDKLSSNAHIGDVYFDVNELVRHAPQPDKDTGLYPVGGEEGEKGAEGMREYSLPLTTAKEMRWQARYNPVIRFRAKYQPYDMLRQRFWKQYLAQYDTNNMCALSYVELRAMLESLGSTLTSTTVSSFFTRYGKHPHEDEISIERTVMCLEEELGGPVREKKKRIGGNGDAEEGEDGGLNPNPVERVINIKNCPLCHRLRLNSKADMDIVTHLAVCASGDWNKMDKIMLGNFVTARQTQRELYTKALERVGWWDNRIRENSANVVIQNRMTGQLEVEKIQVYDWLGIRLLGAWSGMEGGQARRLLKSLSIKHDIKYDDPGSTKEIPAFIEFHGLKMDEILDPLDSFKTFNQFFYRKLKPSARPMECPTDPYRLISAADRRLMTFATVSEATQLWIKGREFSVARLLGEHYKAEAERYVGGALAIFRLAPQDYHRFHSPVEGKVGAMIDVEGENYTVIPQAIRSAVDVYGENTRKIVPIDSPQFGRVFMVCMGAMMARNIKMTVQEGEWVERGQEFGYFAFGGSTIVILFEKGCVEWDKDLLINGRALLETLVQVGMGIGRGKQFLSALPLRSPSM
ncbi:hypothetical protein CVT25_009531 [Psilocybe cyanescens]|uniref:C2 domain-containing protein n=1 Tax=Psilocybe cyanescens TaxID=93625 RepID=A0A409X8G2_PSICY|nr:hypothetical protein CVT25_009531 [Psilocybe cyanescens]